MFCSNCRLQLPHRLHATRSLLLALGVLATLGACDGADSALAPAETDEPPGSAAPNAVGLVGTAQRIVFTSNPSGAYNVFKMDPLGSNLVQLTKYVDYGSEPAWSRDNQRIALIRPRLDPVSKKSYSNIYVIDANGANGHWARSTAFPYDLRFPSWSPDGSRLVMTIMQMGKPYLATLTLATGQIKVVTSGGSGVQGNYPSYNPAGTAIVFVGPTGKSMERITTSGARKVLFWSDANMSEPRYSPDGSKIAYDGLVGINLDIYVRNLAAGTTTRLTTDPAIDEQATWSPDGSRIAFMSLRTGHAQIWVMGANGANPVRITKTSTEEKDPAWSH
jgi:Tol biopolymer transport system component